MAKHSTPERERMAAAAAADAAENATTEKAGDGRDKAGQSSSSGLLDLTDLGLPPPDRAYQLHLRGFTLREIARELHIDKDTAHKYVRELEKETAPWRRDARARWRRQAIAKLEHVQAAAWRSWAVVHDPMLLNTIASCEDKIGRIRGLYDQEVEDGAGGVTITISRRGGGGGLSAQVASARLLGDAGETGATDGGGANEG